MRRFILSFAFLLFVHIAFSQQQYRVVAIGFYNLENYFDTINDPLKNDDEFTPIGTKLYTPEVFFDKTNRLANVISEIGTDQAPEGVALLGVAEIENESVLQTLVQTPQLKSRNYQIIHYESPDKRGIDVGLLYNPKYFKPIKSRPLRVNLNQGEEHEIFTRDILYVEGYFMGEPLYVFVNHWPSRRGGEEASAPFRHIAAQVVRNQIDSIRKVNIDAKIIIMGDLNDNPNNTSITQVIGAKGKESEVKEGDIYNPFYALFKKGIGSSPFQDSWGLFDQIMLSSGFMENYSKGYYFHKAYIFKRNFMIQKSGRYKGYPLRTFSGDNYIGGYSDHLPTYLIFVKPVSK